MRTTAERPRVGVDVRDQPISLKRPINTGLNALSVLVLLLLGGRAYQVWRLNEGLVDDIARRRAREWPRPALVDQTVPGTFGELAGAILEERIRKDPQARAYDLPQDCIDTFTRFRFGVKLTEFPEHCFRAAEERLPEAQRLLAATHAERGGTLTNAWRAPLDGMSANFMHFGSVTNVAALAVLSRLQQGRDAEALVLCRDLLALGRDAAMTAGIEAVWTQTGTLFTVTLVCSGAFARADARTRRQLLTALVRLRSVRPQPADAVELDSLKQRLEFFSVFLTPAQRERLGDPPLTFPDWRVGGHSVPLLRALAMPSLMRFEARRVAAAATPSRYPAELGRLQAELDGAWNPFIENARGRDARSAELTVQMFAAADAKVDLFVALLEVSLDPARLWGVSAAGAPVQLGFVADGRTRFSVDNDKVSALELPLPLLAELGGPSEPGALLFPAK
jgi:hypothetical protein